MTDRHPLIEANRPRCPRPPQANIDAALRAIPNALFTSGRPVDAHGELFVEAHSSLAVYLMDAGFHWVDADWAVHEALCRGLLEVDEKAQRGETRRRTLWIRTTPALWDFWREAIAPPEAGAENLAGENPAMPATVEPGDGEAVADGLGPFVGAHSLWKDRFENYNQFKRWLDGISESELRREKPSKNRLNLHAADWHRFWERHDAEKFSREDGVE